MALESIKRIMMHYSLRAEINILMSSVLGHGWSGVWKSIQPVKDKVIRNWRGCLS